MTLRQALDGLVRRGLLERRGGQGTFVAARKVEQDLRVLRSYPDELRGQGVERDDDRAARRTPCRRRAPWRSALGLGRARAGAPDRATARARPARRCWPRPRGCRPALLPDPRPARWRARCGMRWRPPATASPAPSSVSSRSWRARTRPVLLGVEAGAPLMLVERTQLRSPTTSPWSTPSARSGATGRASWSRSPARWIRPIGHTSAVRVAITGIGVIGPHGVGTDRFWQALCEGRSGIRQAEAPAPPGPRGDGRRRDPRLRSRRPSWRSASRAGWAASRSSPWRASRARAGRRRASPSSSPSAPASPSTPAPAASSRATASCSRAPTPRAASARSTCRTCRPTWVPRTSPSISA